MSDAEADEPAGEHVHDHHHPVALQQDRFAAKQVHAPKTVLAVRDEAQLGRAAGAWRRLVVLCQYAARDVFVDVDTERMSDLLRDAHTAELGITALHFDDRRYECHGRALGTGLTATEGGGKEKSIFPIN